MTRGATAGGRRFGARGWLAALSLLTFINGRPAAANDAGSTEQSFDHEHAAWTALLRRYVRDGLVDYGGLKAQGAGALEAYLRRLSSLGAPEYARWSREERLAFWINAYNAYTVRDILDHYPLDSIRSIGLLPGAAFRDRFIPMEALRGRKLSLDDVEHDILRRELDEPRIHFAIVCASRSCPVLRDESYRARDLDAQLQEAAERFVRDPRRNRYDAATGTFHASAIFKWFREDFERRAGSVASFLASYANEEAAAALRSGSVRIDYLDYDWSLNGS
jgi:Protein of unknown function, DUF547